MKNNIQYKWKFVGSNVVSNLPYKDYEIIDILNNRIIESHNSLFMVKMRIKKLNHEKR